MLGKSAGRVVLPTSPGGLRLRTEAANDFLDLVFDFAIKCFLSRVLQPGQRVPGQVLYLWVLYLLVLSAVPEKGVRLLV